MGLSKLFETVKSSHALCICASLMGVVVGAASAAEAGSDWPPHRPPANWNPADPINIADVRSFVGTRWKAFWCEECPEREDLETRGAGVYFHNPLPDDITLMTAPWTRVYEKLYSSRLMLDPEDGEPAYDLWDLMRDEPLVRERFREFVLTEQIATSPSIDPEVFVQHYILISDAVTSAQLATVESIELDSGIVMSRSMRLVQLAQGAPSQAELTAGQSTDADTNAGGNPSQADADFICWLRYLARASQLPCMRSKGLWKADTDDPNCNQPGHTGESFDCDDFADAMIRWILAHQNGLTNERLLFRWRCPPNTNFEGHWLPVIKRGGRSYVVDPYTGEVKSFPNTRASEKQIAEWWLRKQGFWCDGIEWDERTPRFCDPGGTDYHRREPTPLWWRCKAAIARFCNHLKQCCGSTAIPGPDCAPIPVGVADDDIRRSACDPGNYVRDGERDLVRGISECQGITPVTAGVGPGG